MIVGLLVVVVVELVLVVGLEVVEVVAICVILVVVVLCVVVDLLIVELCVDLGVFAFVILWIVGLTMEVGVGVKSGASNSGYVFDSNAVRLSIVGIFGKGMLKVIKILRSSLILSAVKNGFVVEFNRIGL